MTTDFPTGTVTFLFTDIEGSTQLWERYPEAMQAALARHDALLRQLVEAHHGTIIKTTGDGLHGVFAAAADAANDVLAGQRALQAERQPREVVFALTQCGELVAALCGRWVIPITSEIIIRFDRALATTHARRDMIVTTSYCTDAAIDAACGRPVELHDGKQLAEWIEDIWT